MNRTLAGVVLGAALAVAGCNVSSGSGSGTQGSGTNTDVMQHAEDVKIASCTSQPDTGWAEAQVVVTNNSSKPSDYAITIAFDSPTGTQLGTALVSVSNLQPGQSSAPQEANSLSDAVPGYTCHVADATRFAA